MTSYYSPSVIPTETDFSDYAVRSSSTILAVIGHTLKGPVNTPYLVNSESELIEVFGLPQVYTTVDTQGNDISFSGNIITDAIQYLRQGNQLYVIRACNELSSTSTSFQINDNASGDPYLKLTAVSPGAWADGYDIIVSAATNGNTAYFNLTIQDADGTIVEAFLNLAGANVSGDPTNKPEARINGSSSLFTAKELVEDDDFYPALGTVSSPLTNGSAVRPGQTEIQNALDLLKDTELYTVNLIAIPQVGSPSSVGLPNKAAWNAVTDYAITVCEYRGECMFFIDPFWDDVVDTTPTEAKTALNDGNSGNYDFDSSQGSLYAPWLSVYDGYNRKSVWVAPSCMVAGQYSFNDRVAQPWFAPAGVNRGKLRLAQDVSVVFNRSDLEALQAPRMITNPIRPIINEGITIWGQRTAQRKATALNRVNARRMLNSAKHTIATATRVLLFEQNDSDTWSRFRNLVTPPMQYIKDTRGVYDFRVICDDSTNPPAQIDQNIMRGKILLKPTKSAETIYVDFSILNTGANFDEFV
jgi:uncharacterized protein